jgi:hypothetical protein
MSTTETTNTEMDTGEQLYSISEATNSDGTVDVTLHEYRKLDGAKRVNVLFKSPDGEIRSETMGWPNSDDEKYKFVRLMNRAGMGLVGVDTAFDEGTAVRADPDQWELVAPKRQRSRTIETAVGILSTLKPKHPVKAAFVLLWIGLIACALLLAVGGLLLL